MGMNKLKAAMTAAVIVLVLMASSLSYAQQSHAVAAPPLDPVLSGFKDQGVWYFLCTAPYYPVRIPPHYLTFGPPPPCGPPAPWALPGPQGPHQHMMYRPVSPYRTIEPDGR